MPQSLAQVWIHLVFSTKERRPFLKDDALRDEMFRMLAHHVQQAGCVSVSVGGHVDHVHLLLGLSRTITLAKLVENIKTETTKWMKSAKGKEHFSWQSGYGAFSVSHSKLDDVVKYISSQSEHHRRLTFQEEFRLICETHGLNMDERYVWD